MAVPRDASDPFAESPLREAFDDTAGVAFDLLRISAMASPRAASAPLTFSVFAAGLGVSG